MLVLIKAFNSIVTEVRHLWQGLARLTTQVTAPAETLLYPEEPAPVRPRTRGRLILTRDPDGAERCVACQLCSSVCPSQCIDLKHAEQDGQHSDQPYAEEFRIDFGRCEFCGICEEICPTKALQHTPDFEMGDYQRASLIYEKEHLLIAGVGKYPDYSPYRQAHSSKQVVSKQVVSKQVVVKQVVVKPAVAKSAVPNKGGFVS